MRKYVKFDSVQFLKDSRHWEEETRMLEQELVAITEIGGAGKGMPSGGGVSKPTERTAMDRDKVERKLAKLHKYKTCFVFAWRCLGEADKQLLVGFYYAPGYVYEFVDQWCQKYASNREYCYQAKREAEKHFGDACEKWMELHT